MNETAQQLTENIKEVKLIATEKMQASTALVTKTFDD